MVLSKMYAWGRVAGAAGLVAIAAAGAAGTPVTYYDGANTASGATLRTSLNGILTTGHLRVGYDNTYAALIVTDEDPANTNNVLMVYGGDSRAKTDDGGNNSLPTGGWNKEHIFPQSFFDSLDSTAAPMRSDLHALMPADADINGARSNSPYQNVASPTYTDVFGNRRLGAQGGATTVWEPTNSDKGRVARAALYMDIRYEGASGPDLKLINSYPGGTSAGEMAYLNTMLDWHRLYPPTAWERARNQKVYNRQKNANPFADHPEWAGTIFGGTAWTMADGDTLTVGSTPRTAGSITAGTNDIPVLSLNLGLAANQFHIAQIGVSELGTISDSEVSNLKLWWDVDGNGVASVTDTLLDTRTLSSGSATFAPSHPYYVAPGTGAMGTRLLITASIPASASNGATFQLRVNANGIQPHISGGNDTAPTFSNQDSSVITVGSAVSGGDSVTVVPTSRAPLGSVAGSADVPMLNLGLTVSSNEWDLGSIGLVKLGTVPDSGISSVNLYLDNDADGVVDAGEQLLGSTTFSGTVATLTLNPAHRILAGTKSLLLTASLAFSAPQDATVGIRVAASGLVPSSTGGADVTSTNGNLDSNLTVITASTGGGSNLIISEVFEGTAGSLKYVELHNVGSTPITLSNYTLRRYANGSVTPATMALSGTVNPGGFHVVANNTTDFATAYSPKAPNQVNSSVISHNGNDCYDLVTGGVVVDSFAADRAGAADNFATDIVAFRIGDQLPNNGAWGAVSSLAASTGTSTSGYWAWIKITASNGNAATAGTPGSQGGAAGVEVPVTLSGFTLE